VGLALCLLSFISAFLVGRRRLGHGLGLVLAIGCVYGWLRANLLDGFTHFTFDMALTGFYVSTLPRLRPMRGWSGSYVSIWIILLIGWPLMMVLISPFLNAPHLFVQVAGLRNAILFAPLVLIGSALSREAWREFCLWAEWCVVLVSCFTLAEWLFGLEVVYPLNEATLLIYVSRDITGGYYRLPSSFVSSHAYGGTMLALLPLFLGRLEEQSRRRLLTALAGALVALGVFACGARLPVVLFGLVVGVMLLQQRHGLMASLFLIVMMAVIGYSVSQSERLRRFESLGDTEMVASRISQSVNMSFWEILTEYPMGRGLGSAAGTSVPFFLAEYSKPPVGIENEFARLLLEEGLPGLLGWTGFVVWVLGRSAVGLRRRSSRAAGMWIFCAGTWASGLIGVGILAAIPTTMLLMLYLGELSWEAPRQSTAKEIGWRLGEPQAMEMS
jgi:hypothetical protein